MTVTPCSLPALSIHDVAVARVMLGTTTVGFTVSLSAASHQTVTVDYATADLHRHDGGMPARRLRDAHLCSRRRPSP